MPAAGRCRTAATTAAVTARHRGAGSSVGGRDNAARPRVRLALIVAYVSGLTSLGYQVLWTRLLASGTGDSTYVFTTILTIFLIGLALGAVVFNLLRTRIKTINLLATRPGRDRGPGDRRDGHDHRPGSATRSRS